MLWQFHFDKRYRAPSTPGKNAPGDFALSLHLQSNARRIAIVGASGTGKSQTLMMIAGLIAPDNGYLAFNEDESGQAYLYHHKLGINVPASQRRISYLFQDYALFPHLNVQQNIAFALSSGWRNPPLEGFAPHSVEKAKVGEWLERFNLLSVARHYPHQISGGQAQRVALARALIFQPRALLLDEPFAALDRAHHRQLRGELLALQKSQNLPIILVSHDAEDADQFAEEVWQMEKGAMNKRAF